MKKNKKIKLTIGEVEHVASLAKLTLTPGEIKKYQKQLGKIFGYIEQIRKMKTGKIKETSHSIGSTNVFREDKIDTSSMLTQKEALSNASAKHNGYFKVKSIFEQP